MTNIEKLLYSKTVQTSYNYPDQQGVDLFGFWSILKKQISERLSLISSVFPHYSLHDSSHSEKILDIIWKLYGEDSLKTLSVSNLFLILVVSYAHDLGMTVLSDDFNNVFDSDSFINLVKKIKDNPADPSYEYANCFDIQRNSLVYKNNTVLDEKSYNAARFLLANFFRTKHAERSQGDVKSIFSQYKQFAKNSVIYQIGQICSAHNWDFKKVLELPKNENGIYGDSWNPLFIACALRLGDLLDLESDRFSESYWKSLPSKPFDADLHRKKHEAIKHFSVAQTTIEAYAECDSYEVYQLLNDEFQMVQNEISMQMAHWNIIAPIKNFPSLPSLGKFYVSLKGYDTFEDGEIPCFHINQEKAFELIKGIGFYEDKFIAIREILQNAVDAIYIKCFLENEKSKDELEYEAFNEILKKEKINILITRKSSNKNNGKNTIIWNISISDSGIGMDKSDLKYLLDSASSSNNPFKKDIISRMPEWVKPSGTFGLGFQSIFQLSDKIDISTRKINSPFEYILNLRSPSKGVQSSVFLKTSEPDYSQRCGTTVSFDFEVLAIPETWSISIDEPVANDMIAKFDFVTGACIDYEIARIISAVQKFGFSSQIPIELKVENDEPTVFQKQEVKSIFARKFFKEYGLELLVPESYYPLKYFFRNVVISKTESRLFFVPFSSNILSGNAKNILKINREEFQNTADVWNIMNNTVLAGKQYLIENYGSLTENMKVLASMFVRYYETNENELKNTEIFNKWESYTSSFEHNTIAFKQIVDFSGTVKLIIGHGGNYRNPFYVLKNDTEDEITITTTFNLAEELHFLIKEMLRVGKQILLAGYERSGVTFDIVKRENGKKEIDFIKDYASWFLNILMSPNYTCRFTIPCNGKYEKLAVTGKNSFIPAEQTFSFLKNDFPVGMKMEVMVSPYIVERDGIVAKQLELTSIEEVIDFTYKNRLNQKVSKKEITELFKSFIQETKDAVQAANKNIDEMFVN